MNRSVLFLSLLVLACPAISHAQTNKQLLDCDALSNSADVAPPGYAEQCLPESSNDTLGESVATLGMPTNLAYTYDMRGQASRLPGSLYSFTLDAFSNQKLIGVSQTSIFAMDFNADGTTLYAATGSTASPNPSTFGTLDTVTGAFNAIAPLSGLQPGDSATGITIDPVTDVAYFSGSGGSPSVSHLYSLNLATGALTLIGQMTAPTDGIGTGTIFIDIAINCQGQLYAHNISDDALYSIDPTTGAGTLIGTHGLAV